MSADNYVLIRKEPIHGLGNSAPTSGISIYYVGYVESASTKEPTYSNVLFKSFTLEDAILHAQHLDAEYSYRLEDLDESTS